MENEKKNVSQIFGQNVKKYRKQAGFTQEELSEKLNISQKHLSIIETGIQFASAALIFHNTRSGNPQVDIFFEYYFEWWKKAEKIRTWRNGSFSPLARIKFRLIDKSKRLGRELERAEKEGTTGIY